MDGAMMNSSFTHRLIKSVLFTLACCRFMGVQAIIVPSGKVGPITPYRSTPRPQADPSRPVREPAPVVEYSPEHPEPPPLDPSYIPRSYDALQALSGNSIFYIPLRIKNVYGFKALAGEYHEPQQVTWRGNYYSANANPQNRPQVRAKVTVPVYEVDYAFPESERYSQQQSRPIVVAPLPPNYHPQPPAQRPVQLRADVQHKLKKSSGYTVTGDRLYPKKYWNPNTDSSATDKYHQHYFYVKHINQPTTNR